MTRPGCGKKTKGGKHRKHTPIVSEAQQGLFGAGSRAGKARKMRGITTEELESHLKESKGKNKRKGKSDLKARKKQRQRRAG